MKNVVRGASLRLVAASENTRYRDFQKSLCPTLVRPGADRRRPSASSRRHKCCSTNNHPSRPRRSMARPKTSSRVSTRPRHATATHGSSTLHFSAAKGNRSGLRRLRSRSVVGSSATSSSTTNGMSSGHRTAKLLFGWHLASRVIGPGVMPRPVRETRDFGTLTHSDVHVTACCLNDLNSV